LAAVRATEGAKVVGDRVGDAISMTRCRHGAYALRDRCCCCGWWVDYAITRCAAYCAGTKRGKGGGGGGGRRTYGLQLLNGRGLEAGDGCLLLVGAEVNVVGAA